MGNDLNVTFGSGETAFTVNPKRPDNGKTFGDADVPSGTNSVIYKAAKIMQRGGVELTEPIPTFTDSEIATKISTKEALISAVASYTVTDEVPDNKNYLLERTEVLIPTQDEIDAEKVELETRTDQEISDELVASRKTALATEQVNKIIDDCLEVPTLSQDFIDQFTTIDPDA